MNKLNKKKYCVSQLVYKITLIILVMISKNALGATSVRDLYPDDTDKLKPYSILIAGHIYGDPFGHGSYPAASILGNVDTFNDMKIKLFVSAGDMLMMVDEQNIHNLQKTLIDKLNMPFFNAIGNMDAQNRNLYEAHFGNTYFSFKHQTEIFIYLDTELNDGSITGEQLLYFKGILSDGLADTNIKNIFIITHRLWWNRAYDEFEVVYRHTHVLYPDNNFRSEILPILRDKSHYYHIYLIAGDIGAEKWLPLFYHKDKNNITYIASGVGDSSSDCVIRADISIGRSVSFRPLSLQNRKYDKIENYNLEYWTAQYKDPLENQTSINIYKKLLEKTKGVVSSRRFWYGFLFALVLSLSVYSSYKYYIRCKPNYKD